MGGAFLPWKDQALQWLATAAQLRKDPGMATFSSILCAVDFSEQSRQALRWAKAVGDRYRSRLIVLNAVDPLLAQAAQIRLGLDLATTDSAPALDEFVRGTEGFEPPAAGDLAFEVRVGEPAEAILDTAGTQGAKLIVMGTQGLGGYRKWLLGSTTERVLRRTRIPVLAVPPAASAPAAGRFDPGRILAATDFSDASIHAARWAATLAREIGSPLLIVHVVEPGGVLTPWRDYVEAIDEARMTHARDRLAGLAEQIDAPCETFVALGRTADSIAATAEEREAGLIVVGLTGDTGRDDRRPGSIAYRVLCLARAPVLVIPSGETVAP